MIVQKIKNPYRGIGEIRFAVTTSWDFDQSIRSANGVSDDKLSPGYQRSLEHWRRYAKRAEIPRDFDPFVCVVGTGVDPVTYRFSGGRSPN